MANKRKSARRTARKQSSTKQRSHARHAVLAKRKRTAQSRTGRRTLYPAIEPYASGYLRVSKEHELYYEECGNLTVNPRCSYMVDPARVATCAPVASSIRCLSHHLVRSARLRPEPPHASLVDNTTWHLVTDIGAVADPSGHRQVARVRRLVGLDARRSPIRKRIRSGWAGSLLRGMFMLSEFELRWFYQEGASNMFPGSLGAATSRRFRRERTATTDSCVLYAPHERGSRDAFVLKAARAWSIWEASTSYLHVSEGERAQVGRRGLHRSPSRASSATTS